MDSISSKFRWISDLDIYTTSQFSWINNKQSLNQFAALVHLKWKPIAFYSILFFKGILNDETYAAEHLCVDIF